MVPARMAMFFLFALQASFPSACPGCAVLVFDAFPVRTCVDIVVNFPMGWLIFVRICMKRFNFDHNVFIFLLCKVVNYCLRLFTVVYSVTRTYTLI